MCNDVTTLSSILLIKEILEIIYIVIPIILILLCIIDLVKNMMNAEKTNIKIIIKRITYAMFIFFVPLTVNIAIDLLGETNVLETDCWTNANKETVSSLQAIEQAKNKAKLKSINEKREKEENEAKAKKKAEYELFKAKLKELGSDKLLEENGEDGQVTVVNGVFYKPSTYTSGSDGTKGSAPYGYNKYFYNRLKKMIDDAASVGYTINMSTSEYGAWRPYSIQKYYYNCYRTKSCNNGNLASYPGTSNHGWGIASDLKFGSYKAKLWAHDNASKYGLNFSVCQNIRGYCVEDWHIEPSNIQRK